MLDNFPWMKQFKIRPFIANYARFFFMDAAVSPVTRNIRSRRLIFQSDTQGTSESNYPFDSARMKDLFETFQNISGGL